MSSLVFHQVFWQEYVSFTCLRHLSPIKINQKSIRYFSDVTSLWSNCSSHHRDAIPFPVLQKQCTWKRDQAIAHPQRIPDTPWLISAFVWGLLFLLRFLNCAGTTDGNSFYSVVADVQFSPLNLTIHFSLRELVKKKKKANLLTLPQAAFLQDPVQFLVSFILFSDQQRYEKNSIITHTLLWCVGTNSTAAAIAEWEQDEETDKWTK